MFRDFAQMAAAEYTHAELRTTADAKLLKPKEEHGCMPENFKLQLLGQRITQVRRNITQKMMHKYRRMRVKKAGPWGGAAIARQMTEDGVDIGEASPGRINSNMQYKLQTIKSTRIQMDTHISTVNVSLP